MKCTYKPLYCDRKSQEYESMYQNNSCSGANKGVEESALERQPAAGNKREEKEY